MKNSAANFRWDRRRRLSPVDAAGRYAGLALVAEAHAPDTEPSKGLSGILHYRDVVLYPVMNIQEAIAVFDFAEANRLS